MKRVFPDRKIVDLPPDHPIFHCFYKFDELPADAGPRVVPAGPHVGEGRLRRAPARDRGRQRPRDGPHQLERRHGRRLGVVERGGVSGLREVHRDGVPDGDQRNHLLADTLMTHRHHAAGTDRRGRRARRRRPRAHPRRDPQGHRRPGRGDRSGADGALHRRALPDHRRARARQDAADQDARADPGPVVQADPVHARPDAGRHHRHRGARRGGRPPQRCAS